MWTTVTHEYVADGEDREVDLAVDLTADGDVREVKLFDATYDPEACRYVFHHLPLPPAIEATINWDELEAAAHASATLRCEIEEDDL